jgi:hypothetical protein
LLESPQQVLLIFGHSLLNCQIPELLQLLQACASLCKLVKVFCHLADEDAQDEGDNTLDDSFVDPTENADSGEDGDTEGNYTSTKALGDADREVSFFSLIYS